MVESAISADIVIVSCDSVQIPRAFGIARDDIAAE
jgi:hypothetical protein